MFGKPQWFRVRHASWGLMPATRQGWAWAGIWGGVIVLPFLWLITRGQAIESLVWLAASATMLCHNVHQLLDQLVPERKFARRGWFGRRPRDVAGRRDALRV